MTIKMFWIESRWEKPDDFIPHSGDLLSSKVNEKSRDTLEESKSSDSHSDSDGEKETEKGEASTETSKPKIKFKVGSWFILYRTLPITESSTDLLSFLVKIEIKPRHRFLANG